ncbi:SET and MYND domain protein [Talaromyces pinophilus]|uniref:SET and MYND domain protein n=1 Tax=Talaromyces pinophilus TaxID=128442 RepID=A0A6V8HKA7_TALPI|nr:SET and MYND domain protein [Talaromyces pinophilus]
MVTSTANSARTEVRPAEQNGISIGLGVFATTDIKKSADIVVLDQPPIALVEEKQLKNICSGCYDVGKGGSIDNRRPGLVKACVRCKVVSYCDKNCQRKDWKAGHSLECSIYAKLHPKVLPLPVRAILRIVLCWKNDKIPKEVWDEFNALTFPKIYEGESQEARDHALMTKAVMEYGNLKDLDPDWMKELFGKLNANSFTLTTAYGRRRGVYLHPGAARFNHSCDPNASYSFDKGKLYVRAIRPIAKDEQISIPYIDVTYSVGTRRHELKDRYKFDCRCTRCQHDMDTIKPEEIKKRGELEQSTNSKIDDIVKSSSASASGTGFATAWKLSSMIRKLSEKTDWDAVNTQQQPLAALRTEIMLCKAHDQMYKQSAVDAAVRHLRTDPTQYPDECHPMRREHAYEFFWHLLYADKAMEMQGDPKDYDSPFDIHEIKPLFYAWMVLNWMLYGNVQGEIIAGTRKLMDEVVWPNPTLKAQAENDIVWVTEDLCAAGMLWEHRDKNIAKHLKSMEEIVETTLKQEKRNTWG